MKDSLFSILAVYKPRENRTPEENFTTEILVYLLKYSQRRSQILLMDFMKLLDGKMTEDLNTIEIHTQKRFITKNKYVAIPDITICEKDRTLFIEVKVESDLNYYSVNGTDEKQFVENQIERYQGISVTNKEIYLLTKHRHVSSFASCRDYKENILWQDIYDVFKKYESNDPIEKYLIHQFLRYMEDKRMKAPRVSQDLIKGIGALLDLASQLQFAIDNYKIPKSRSPHGSWMGYNLKDRENKNMGYVGLNFEDANFERTRLIYQYANKHREYFVFDEHDYFNLSSEDQLKELSDWINHHYNLDLGLRNIGNSP